MLCETRVSLREGKKTKKKKIRKQETTSELSNKNNLEKHTSCVIPTSPCVIRASKWGSYMLQPYYPGLDAVEGDNRSGALLNRQLVVEAREELQSIIDHLWKTGKINRQYDVNIFGSCFVHIWWDGYGDIDFSITPSKEQETNDEFVNIDIAKRDEKVLLLKIVDTIKFLSPSPKGNIVPILGARVPILKYTKKLLNKSVISKRISWKGICSITQHCAPLDVEKSEFSYIGKLLRKSNTLPLENNEKSQLRPLEVVHLHSFTIVFFPCSQPENVADRSRLEIQESLLKELNYEKETLQGSCQDDFFKVNKAFFLWDEKHNTLHITLHDKFPIGGQRGFTSNFIRVFLGVRELRRLGPGPVKLVKYDDEDMREEILQNIAAQMKFYYNNSMKANSRNSLCDVVYRFVPLSLFSIDFDLSLRRLGLRNSKLLQNYFNPDLKKQRLMNTDVPRIGSTIIRVGALYLKSWSKKAGINNSSAGMLCTYAINIMWLHFLLYKSYREGIDTDRYTLIDFIDPDRITKTDCAKKLVELQTYLYSEPHEELEHLLKNDSFYLSKHYLRNSCTLGSLIMEFFRYYGETFDWDRLVITINRTSETTKDMIGWSHTEDGKGKRMVETSYSVPMNQKYLVAIEDPYEKGFNLGRNINSTTFPVIKNQFLKEWLRMDTETPQDVVFKRIACMALKRTPLGQLDKGTNESAATSDLERSKKIENILKSLRDKFYADDSCSDIYSRIPANNGALEVVPAHVPEKIVEELIHTIGQKVDPPKILKHVVRLFAAASIEFSMKCIPSKIHHKNAESQVIEVHYLPIEAALIKVLHASITHRFDQKAFNKNFGYLTRIPSDKKRFCSSCNNPMQNKYYSSKPFHTNVRTYVTWVYPNLSHIQSWITTRRKIF